MRIDIAKKSILGSCVFIVALTFSFGLGFSWAAEPYFEDGYLGLTQQDLRAKLGKPMAVRARKAALRVFGYYSLKDWERYFKKLMSPENGEDVYVFNRNGIQVRYAFVYQPDRNEHKDFPTLYVKRVEVEFTPAVPLKQIPDLVPEFDPPTDPAALAFRSNLWVLLFKGPPSPRARFIVTERGKESFDWTLAYQMYAIQGLPDFLTLDALIDRLEISTQSIGVVKTRQRHTHEPIMNPFSAEFANRPRPAAPQPKPIPRPQYAE
ncbi:MAG: hypothetical protein D6690_17585 [Nitrospirae bacterium]|nr:MAG: hypothetical protein D6690_17585 [Nitrospirota bacterium]